MTEINVELRDGNQNDWNQRFKTDEENLNERNTHTPKGFVPLYSITQAVGLLSIILILYWIFAFNKGFSLSTPISEFNWHPFLMSLGMIYLTGNALLTFRIIRNKPKNVLKIIHASLNGVTFLMVLIASVAVYDYHNKLGYPHLYSVHSWIGLIASILFITQSCIGFSAFLYPRFQDSLRTILLPYHVFFGQVIFVLAIAAAVCGITQKAMFSIAYYSRLPMAGIVLNITSILFIIFGILVIYLTSNINYKRCPRPGDKVHS